MHKAGQAGGVVAVLPGKLVSTTHHGGGNDVPRKKREREIVNLRVYWRRRIVVRESVMRTRWCDNLMGGSMVEDFRWFSKTCNEFL